MLLNDQLLGFIKICEMGSVLSAAQSMGLTQSALTQRLKSLEEKLGVSLFTRSRKGMTLTIEGRELEWHCRQILQSEGELLAKLQNNVKHRVVEIAICGPSSIMRSRMIKRLKPIFAEFPFLRWRFELIDTASGQHKLKTGDCHFAILPHFQVNAEFDSKVLKPERYIFVGHPKFKKMDLDQLLETVPIIDFDPNDEMTFEFLRKNKRFPSNLPARHFANNTDALKDLLIEGLGVSVLSQEFAEPYLKNKTLINLTPEWLLEYPVALAWYPRKQSPEYFKEIIRCLSKN
jgi:LysR family transcriptional regulator (chromosome initiation inhibitor)